MTNNRVEINKNIYSFQPGEKCCDKFLVIEEEIDQKNQLQVFKGWNYNIWPSIGERGAMCEVGELLIRTSDDDIKFSIEEYVKIYRDAFKNEKPIEKIFEDYNIKAIARRSTIYDTENNYYIKKYITEGKMHETTKRDVLIFYEKTISTIEELKLFPLKIDEKGFCFNLEFSKKINLQQSLEIDKNKKQCWREKGCVFNSNFPSFMKCQRNNYSVSQCKKDNKKEWDKIDKLKGSQQGC